MFQKDMKISLLVDFYGDILTERRRSIIQMYYDEDLSLAEIAEETGISRQGVRDSIKKSASELTALEDKLGLAARFEKIKSETETISSLLSSALDADTKEASDSLVKEAAEKLGALEL